MFSETLKPSLEEVLAAPTDASIPVWRALPSDTETPISAFLKLRRGGTGFLLESAEQDGSLGRYSFIGVGPDAVLRADLDRGTVETQSGIASYEASPIEALRQLVGSAPVHQLGDELPGFVGGAVGALGFDLVRSIEKRERINPDFRLLAANKDPTLYRAVRGDQPSSERHSLTQTFLQKKHQLPLCFADSFSQLSYPPRGFQKTL